ncbi:hypothetical protein [Neptunicella marina]|uniref:Uncharacterized protein n=1 Tax=Neptunicella marina TaxID=2125989 RepID=A0A8J6M2I4_9ALTE|nr:hypothetical protein [Neptunicella marina]MBC3766328.1 hypothetical protein [Neptunicella marina]
MRVEDYCQMELVGRVLFVKLHKVWTRNIVDKVLAEVQQTVVNIQDEPWAACVDIRQWIMPTPDALSGFQLIYDWCIEHNQTHEVTVCRLQAQANIIGDVSQYDPEFHYYTQDPEEAVLWLNQQGFQCALPAEFK